MTESFLPLLRGRWREAPEGADAMPCPLRFARKNSLSTSPVNGGGNSNALVIPGAHRVSDARE
jgi:hypothetical protein